MPRTLEAEKELAVARPITGPYPEFARELRRLMGHTDERPFLTGRMLSQKSHVSYTTIGEAMRGYRPGEASIQRLAHVLDADAGRLMRLAKYPASNYPPLPSIPETEAEESFILSVFRTLSPSGRRTLLAVAEAIRGTDAADAT